MPEDLHSAPTAECGTTAHVQQHNIATCEVIIDAHPDCGPWPACALLPAPAAWANSCNHSKVSVAPQFSWSLSLCHMLAVAMHLLTFVRSNKAEERATQKQQCFAASSSVTDISLDSAELMYDALHHMPYASIQAKFCQAAAAVQVRDVKQDV